MYENLFQIILIILTVMIMAVLLIKRFVYFRPDHNFLQHKGSYQDISEGNLHGWFIEGKDKKASDEKTPNKKVVLFCHGNGGNISHRQSHIDALSKLGYDVLIFDYSGYGRSIGIPSEQQFYHDASVFTEILLSRYDKNDIILYGESMGAAVASYIAVKYRINTIIIDSGLPSVQRYVKRNYGILGFLSFLFTGFETDTYLKNCKGKILVMHSPSDDIIPYDITDVMRNSATSVINITGTHNIRNIPWEQVDKFIKS